MEPSSAGITQIRSKGLSQLQSIWIEAPLVYLAVNHTLPNLRI